MTILVRSSDINCSVLETLTQENFGSFIQFRLMTNIQNVSSSVDLNVVHGLPGPQLGSEGRACPKQWAAHGDLGNFPKLPPEIWQEIVNISIQTLSCDEALRLRLVSKEFYAMAMKTLFESDKIFYSDSDSDSEDYGFVCTKHLKYVDDDDSGSEDQSSEYNFVPPLPDDDDDDDHSLDATERAQKHGFWTDYVASRVFDRVKTKKPSYHHLFIGKIAERIFKWRTNKRQGEAVDNAGMKPDAELEQIVHQVSGLAVCFGYDYERQEDFLEATRMNYSHVQGSPPDESCLLFKNALLSAAVYLDEKALLKYLLKNDTTDDVDDDSETDESELSDSDGLRTTLPWGPRRQGFGRFPARDYAWRRCRCVQTCLWVGSPAEIAVQTGNMECAILLMRTMAEYSDELDRCKLSMIMEAVRLQKLDFMAMVVETIPPLRPCSRLYYMHRHLYGIVETTTDPRVFDLLYPIISKTCKMGEFPWWQSYGPEFKTWGTRRLRRAVDDGCLPIVKTLLSFKFKLEQQPMVRAIQKGHEDVVRYFVSIGASFEGALAAAAEKGNLEMAKFLLENGGGKAIEDLRKAVRVAMMDNHEGIARLIIDSARNRRLLGGSKKAEWKRELESRSRDNMLGLLDLMRE
ncbi:altered inheritance of mitochondria 6 [Fusarium albosuccineum]|uniref:Altered inheritance of mitochondria 6 n=1 Tax=Fusarium albosuccineum TaxID=1237068 RepID=A0A8H4L256_9HYPO|nr:altered inheritance of mitochondria 6 [Fusarium albosuccineum]